MTHSRTLFRFALVPALLLAACGRDPAKVAAFAVQVPAAVTAGDPLSVRVTALAGDGQTLTGYRGTVHLSSDDAAAVLPADLVFEGADRGVKTAQVTLKSAGGRKISASAVDVAATGAANVTVAPGAASRLELSGAPDSAAVGDSIVVAVTARDACGNVAVGYRGTVSVGTDDPAATVSPSHAFTADDAGRAFFALTFGTARVGAVGVSASDASGAVAAARANVGVHAGPAVLLRVLDLAAQTEADQLVSFRLRAEDRFGNAATGYTGTVRVLLTDLSAPVVPDVAFSAGDAGEKLVSVAFYSAGPQSVIVSDGTRGTSSELQVKHASTFSYSLSALPPVSIAGSPLPLVITAVDRHGNVADRYAGSAHVASADPMDLLPADGAFAQGVRTVAIAFRSTGNHQVSVNEVGGSISAASTEVLVSADDAAELDVSAPVQAVAGAQLAATVRARDRFGNTSSSFGGTVSFTSSDASAILPPPYRFNPAADAGQHLFQVTFATAGNESLAVTAPAASGMASFAVSHAAPAQCSLGGLPASATAGSQLAARALVTDAYGNTATGYDGTLAFSANDPRATLSASSATFVPAVDAGSRAFGVRLVSTGSRTISAADAANGISCSAGVGVEPAALHLAVSVPPDPMAGVAQAVNVGLVDAFDNAVSSSDTVSLSTSDAAAAGLPASVVLVGGTASVGITFRTVGSATVNAVSQADAAVTGAAPVTVHGLVYTDPPPGAGKVRLVRNASSFGDLVQLDLVSNTRLITSGGGASRRNGAFAVAMNVPVAPDSITMDSTPFVEGNVLAMGAAPKAEGAMLLTTGPAANVLLSGASQKQAPTVPPAAPGSTVGDAAVASGQVFYSVRLRIAPGAVYRTVFDGSALPVAFKASVRDRSGVDTIRLEDFALGKLELR